MSGTRDFADLTIGSTTEVTVTATATAADGTPLEASAITAITTPEIPILIGQLADGSWQPNVGVTGFSSGTPGVYLYTPRFTDNGEFSFVSKLGTTSADWATVNSHPRYSPAGDASQVAAPVDTPVAYTRYDGSTTGSWVPSPYEPSRDYLVIFDFNTQTVEVKYADALSGAIDITTYRDTLIYDINGVVVGNGGPDSLGELPGGIYIVGGNKVLVR